MFKINRTLNRNILRLAVPSILASITVPLVGIVDTAIVGHLSDAHAIGGVAIGSMLFDLLYWNFGFLRVGTGGMTAQAYGRNDKTGMANILTQSLGTALGAAMLIWLVQTLFLDLVLWIVPCSPAVDAFARQYYFIRIWGAPATLSLLALKGWYIGMQNTMIPMACDLVVNIVNIVASYYLAVMTPIGAIGVAYGTLIAQYSGVTVALLMLFVRYRHVLKAVKLKEALHWNEFKHLFTLNSNLFVRSLCFMIVYAGFTSFATVYGDTELAVSSIMMKLFMLFSYFIDGFAYAGEALTGKFWGRKDRKSIVSVVRILFWWTTGVAIVCTAIYFFGGDWMLRIMTNDLAIIYASKPYMVWLILMPLLGCYAFMWDGIFIGATAGKEARNCMIAAMLGFLVFYLALRGTWGIQTLYAAYFIHLLVRAVYLSVRWRPVLNTLNKS